MLSIEKEERIRRRIRNGECNHSIVVNESTGHISVQHIREVLHEIDSHTIEVREHVLLMTIAGFPVSMISAIKQVSPEYVKAVSRYFYIRAIRSNKKKIEPLCVICKQEVSSRCEKLPSQEDVEVSDSSILNKARDFYNIACDVVYLDDLGLVVSPLFGGIASAARVAIAGTIEEKKDA